MPLSFTPLTPIVKERRYKQSHQKPGHNSGSRALRIGRVLLTVSGAPLFQVQIRKSEAIWSKVLPLYIRCEPRWP